MDQTEASPTIQLATEPEELKAVFRQRYRVYVEELNLYRDLADHENRSIRDEDDDTGMFLIAKQHERVVGSLRIHTGQQGELPQNFMGPLEVDRFTAVLPISEIGVISRLTLDPDYRGGTLAFGLMQRSYLYCLENSIEVILADCIPELINMYLALGLRPYARVLNDPHTGFLVPMALAVRDADYLKRTRSIAWRDLKKFGDTKPLPNWPAKIFGESSPVVSKKSDYSNTYIPTVLDDFEIFRERSSSLFFGLEPGEIQFLLDNSHLIELSAGDKIIAEGTMGKSMYLMLSGIAEVIREGAMVGVLTEGDVFGELAFLRQAERTATVRALSDTIKVLCLNDQIILKIIKTEPEIGTRVLLNLARGLAEKLLEREVTPSQPE